MAVEPIRGPEFCDFSGRVGTIWPLFIEVWGLGFGGGEGFLIPYIVGRGLGPALSQLTFRASRMFQVPVEQDSWSWFVDYGGPFNRNGGSGEQSPPSVYPEARRGGSGGRL